MPLVSILMPCYNSEATITASIQSVLKQSFLTWELIVVDDASTDHTATIVSQLAKADRRIKFIQLPSNSGSPVVPRNTGLKAASGEYIAFLDSDDIWFENKLRIQIDYMQLKKCLFSYSSYMIFSNGKSKIYLPPKSVSYKELLKLNVLGCLTVVVHKSLIGECRFRNILVEDYEFWLRLLSSHSIIAYRCSELALAQYNVISGSHSSEKVTLIKGYFNIFKNIYGNTWVTLFKLSSYIFRYFRKY